jgi:hypothetical protein
LRWCPVCADACGMEGVLEKWGGAAKGWQPRRFQIAVGVLSMTSIKQPSAVVAAAKGSELLGGQGAARGEPRCIALAASTVMEDPLEVRAFEVKTENGGRLPLRAASLEARDAWVAALRSGAALPVALETRSACAVMHVRG